jgi:hypothetical protein
MATKRLMKNAKADGLLLVDQPADPATYVIAGGAAHTHPQ